MIRLALKNILHKGLNSTLSWVSLSLSIGIISVLMMLQNCYEKQFLKNIEGVDMVLGAKGSPLQLILSAVFHIDAPTGNISFEEAQKWMHHPSVQKAIPLAYGDSYRGVSIVGSDYSLLQHYGATIQFGRLFTQEFEVVIGSDVAKRMQLSAGDQFYSTHGQDEHGQEHRDYPYSVAGVLAPTGTLIDNIIVGNIESVWKIHDHRGNRHEQQAHVAHEIQEHTAQQNIHDHEHADHEPKDENKQKELTAVLIRFKNPMGIVQLPRIINKQSNLMSAVPAIEINRMFSLLGVGISVLTYIGAGIMLLSAFSIFVALYNSLKERKYEIALLRATGRTRGSIIVLLISEALLLSITGIITGILLSRIILLLISTYLATDYHLSAGFTAGLLPKELYMIGCAIIITLLAALVPALKAGFINISKTLANG